MPIIQLHIQGLTHHDIAERREEFLQTAETLFCKNGYEQTGVQEILDVLHASKGSFYHHFESKLQVLTELCRQKTAVSFAAYQEKQYETPLDQLNGLIYYAMPFRDGEEKTVAVDEAFGLIRQMINQE